MKSLNRPNDKNKRKSNVSTSKMQIVLRNYLQELFPNQGKYYSFIYFYIFLYLFYFLFFLFFIFFIIFVVLFIFIYIYSKNALAVK